MKEILLKKDVISYLQNEIVRIRKSEPNWLINNENKSYLLGYKEGELTALTRVLNYVYGINTRLPRN